jgi:hypothetical protein
MGSSSKLKARRKLKAESAKRETAGRRRAESWERGAKGEGLRARRFHHEGHEAHEEGLPQLSEITEREVSVLKSIHEIIIVLVSANPKPNHAFILAPRNGAVMQTDIGRPDSAFRGKSQGWMKRI